MAGKAIINITSAAWKKINHITLKNNLGMLLSASSGGCNGFNYSLTTIKDKEEIKNLANPSILKNRDSIIYIDPKVELYLIGTTIDFTEEDYANNIYESKFNFIPDQNIAYSCGCGVSFSPHDLH